MLDHLGGLKRTRHCGELNAGHIGEETTLMGWVAKQRDLGQLIFIDLRDRWGVTQLVFDAEDDSAVHAKAKSVRAEWVIAATGAVRKRESANPNMPTGEVEIVVRELLILNRAAVPPFVIEEDMGGVGEELRLRHRYLDLRRHRLQKNFILRHKAALEARRYLDEQGFLELETPMLTRATPEGARDYLVPSRVHKGSFYALPQSPQIFKQLFMVSGFDRYFQITRCFRDEDQRADRQPEFTQIDIEMSFVQPEDVFALVEPLMARLMKLIGVTVETPFPRMAYRDAMDRYGSDKPDVRFDMPLTDFSERVRDCGFKVFSGCVAGGGRVKGLCAPGAAGKSRKDIEALESWLKRDYGVRGLAWLKCTADGVSGPIKKFLGEELAAGLFAQAGGGEGDLLLFVADSAERANQSLGALRARLGEDLGLIDERRFSFLWITEFPLLEYDAEAGRYLAMHHPFTAPLDEDLALLASDPGKARAQAYDLTLNGFEIGGGSIRIHRRDVQDAMFAALGLSDAEAEDQFGFLLDALSYGAPPHGGVAFGFDRIVMLLAGEKSLREVIAFPKTSNAQCLMTGAPAAAEPRQLAELGIELADKTGEEPSGA